MNENKSDQARIGDPGLSSQSLPDGCETEDRPEARQSSLKQRISSLSRNQRAVLLGRFGKGKPAPPLAGESIQGISRARTLRIETDPEATVYPASRGQQRMLFLQYYSPDSAAYNVPSAFHLVGELNVSRIQQAFEAVIGRHDILRTSYAMGEEGLITQRVRKSSDFRLCPIDLAERPDPERMAEAGRRIDAEAARPFDLEQGPPFRAVLVRLQPSEHVLLVVAHHIMFDGWSRSNLYRELSAAYSALEAGRPQQQCELPVQFADYSAWHEHWLNSGVLDSQSSYWTQKLSGKSVLQDLPSDRARPSLQSFRGHCLTRRLDSGLPGRLTARAQEESATLFMLLLAAFKVLLHRYTGQEDLIVGVPVANRRRVEAEGLIGFFANTLVMRTECRPDLTFREFLRRVKETAVGAYGNQDMPFERLVELLRVPRDPGRPPLFQTTFAIRDYPNIVFTLPEIQSRPWPVTTNTSKFDLSMTLERSADEWVAVAEYSTDLFDAPRVERLLEHWCGILKGIAANPDQRVSEIPMLGPDERRQFLEEWNQPARGIVPQ